MTDPQLRVLVVGVAADSDDMAIETAAGWAEARERLDAGLPFDVVLVDGDALPATPAEIAAVTALAAVVVESMFPTIREALVNRLHVYFGPAAVPLTPVFLWLFRARLGIAPESLEPIASIGSLHVPLLIASGTADRYTTVAETRRLADAASEPKTLWLVPGAGHVDLRAYDPVTYDACVFRFLDDHLRARP